MYTKYHQNLRDAISGLYGTHFDAYREWAVNKHVICILCRLGCWGLDVMLQLFNLTVPDDKSHFYCLFYRRFRKISRDHLNKTCQLNVVQS